MKPFDANSYPELYGSAPDARTRLAGAHMPTGDEEEWRYSPILDFDITKYELAPAPTALTESELTELLSRYESDNIAITRNGHIVHTQGRFQAVDATSEDNAIELGVEPNGDIYCDMNLVYGSSELLIEAQRSEVIEDTFVIIHLLDETGVVAMPRIQVRAGDGSQLRIIEVLNADNVDAVYNTVFSATVGNDANVGHVVLQDLARSVTYIGNQISEIAQQALFHSSTAAFGANWSRLRADCRLNGRGSTGNLGSIYFGDTDQILDFRTFQDHNAADTTSNLLFKGALDDRARGVYSGLIRVAEIAQGTNAYQTNRTIKLAEDTWAESVPNLEIDTNDVRCSHASTMGPIDADQRYYLETRGIAPDVADRLIVAGFFDEVIDDFPTVELTDVIREEIAQKLHKSQQKEAKETERV